MFPSLCTLLMDRLRQLSPQEEQASMSSFPPTRWSLVNSQRWFRTYLGGTRGPFPSPFCSCYQGRVLASSACATRIVALAPLHVPVLIVGERGSGKATTARALHHLSDRSNFSSENATASVAHESPHDSTIYLPGVERLDSRTQAHWAQWLQTPPDRHSSRMVASTSVRLDHCDGFDQDLVRKLLRFRIELPPLRERQEDVGPLNGINDRLCGCRIWSSSTAGN